MSATGVNENKLLLDDAKAARVQTLVDLLEYRARRHPTQVAFRYLQGDGSEKATITYAALQHRARAIAVQLTQQVVTGDRVLLLVPPGLEYVAAYFGCLYAGAVAPTRRSACNTHGCGLRCARGNCRRRADGAH